MKAPSIFHGVALASCALALLPAVHAQTAPAASTIKEITLTGNPLGATDSVAPAAVLTGTPLLLKRESTLGETLANTPGVSSTYFGPNASRPIVRGQDGDRIRVLQNGGGSLDASGLSFDHALPQDPLTVERIEVLRGPSALPYGGQALGGVVNVIDNRIPRQALFDAQGGSTGKADLGLASGDASKNAGFMLEGGTDRYALHADLSTRRSADVAAPIALACTKPGAPALAQRICNSAADAQSAAVGGSVFFDRGYVGASLARYTSAYGTVAEDNTTIRMRQERYALEGQLRVGGALESIKAQLSGSAYTHTEFDGAQPKTTFNNNGQSLRLEARHAAWGPLTGVVGLQAENSRFSADGAEAFAPYSRSASAALFALEDWAQPWGKLSAGARLESASAVSDGNPALARFTPGSNRFSLHSYALGGLWRAAPAWELTANLGYSERAPKDYELYANGPHGATGAYEVGNAQFAKEQATSVDAGVAWKSGPHKASLSAFSTRFQNYIYLDPTGINRDADGNGAGGVGVTDVANPGFSDQSGGTAQVLPEFNYRQVRARFYGLEASGTARLLEATGQTVDLELRGDLLRADNLSLGQALPRIAPARLGATLAWAQGPWGARMGVDASARQSRVPLGQIATDGYALWNAALTYRMRTPVPEGGQVLWYAKIANATNAKAYSATSILTQTAPGKAPLPGRSLKLGMQASF